MKGIASTGKTDKPSPKLSGLVNLREKIKAYISEVGRTVITITLSMQIRVKIRLREIQQDQALLSRSNNNSDSDDDGGSSRLQFMCLTLMMGEATAVFSTFVSNYDRWKIGFMQSKAGSAYRGLRSDPSPHLLDGPFPSCHSQPLPPLPASLKTGPHSCL